MKSTAATSVTVRLAERVDLFDIVKLQRYSMLALGREFYDALQIESILRYMPMMEDYFVSDRTYYVAEVGGRIVGCGGWSSRLPAYHDAVSGNQSLAYATPKVRAMYVHPDFTRCGIGRRLLEVIERAMAASGHGDANLDAVLPGVPLYLKCGYQPLRDMHVSFPNGVQLPVVCMRKRLELA